MDVSVFPLGFEKHLIFCIVAALIFFIQFFRTKYWYELVLAVAVPLSLLVYVNDSTKWFYAVGILEAVLLMTALISYCVQYRKNRIREKAEQVQKEAAEQADETAAEASA